MRVRLEAASWEGVRFEGLGISLFFADDVVLLALLLNGLQLLQ